MVLQDGQIQLASITVVSVTFSCKSCPIKLLLHHFSRILRLQLGFIFCFFIAFICFKNVSFALFNSCDIVSFICFSSRSVDCIWKFCRCFNCSCSAKRRRRNIFDVEQLQFHLPLFSFQRSITHILILFLTKIIYAA